MARIRVGAEDFDPGAELAALQQAAGDAGALASFMGLVRRGSESADGAPGIEAMTLEHYPGMTERAIAAMAAEAEARWSLLGCTILHRIGRIPAGGRIVLVATAAPHRAAALEATTFLIDWLKVDAPFWKQEHFADGSSRWVAARAEDTAAAAQWGKASA